MSLPFERSLRSLSSDSPGGVVLGILVVVVFTGAWLAWFTQSTMTVYAVTDTARVEVDGAAFPVDTAVSGRIMTTDLTLGRHVVAGDVLLTEDDRMLQLDLLEKRTRVSGMALGLATLEREIVSKQAAFQEQGEAREAAIAEANAYLRASQALARFTEKEAKRATDLNEVGVTSEIELAHNRNEAIIRQTDVEAHDAALRLRVAERKSDRSTMEAEIAELSRKAEELRTQQSALEVAVQEVTQQIELRKVRAPITGQLGEIAPLQPGSVVNMGVRVAVIVPQRRLRVVATFAPAVVIGRVRSGQSGRIRLEGYPWGQYGTLPLTVTNVGSELREGKVRIELSFDGAPPANIRLEHGLPGTVEVAVEQASPVALVVRAAGRMVQNAPRKRS